MCAPVTESPALAPSLHVAVALIWVPLFRSPAHTQSLRCVQLLVIPRYIACQAPLSVGFFQVRIMEWVVISFSRGSSWPEDCTGTSWIGRWILYHRATSEAHYVGLHFLKLAHSFYLKILLLQREILYPSFSYWCQRYRNTEHPENMLLGAVVGEGEEGGGEGSDSSFQWAPRERASQQNWTATSQTLPHFHKRKLSLRNIEGSYKKQGQSPTKS